MKRLIGMVAAGLAVLGVAGTAVAAPPEKPKLEIGVGGKPLLYYLPLTLAERLGYFKDEGLDVTVNDFGGGSKALQALVGGSVDAVTGAYEHTIRMQQKGQDIAAVIELGRFPGIVLAVSTAKADKVKSVADLKGMKIGVTAPGSSTHLTVTYQMIKAGLAADDASFIGVGGGASAVAALENGNVDAISHLDPVISKLEADGAAKVLVDTRTEAGTRAVFGGTNPAAVLYLKRDFIKANPNTVQALTNAFYRTLKWIEKASPDEIAAKVPEEYMLGDKALYLKALKASIPTYSQNGLIPPEGMDSTMKFLQTTEASFKDAKIDVAASFDPTFVKKAAATVK
jgi:NitT/TauT family transport system substrate-binding protein